MSSRYLLNHPSVRSRTSFTSKRHSTYKLQEALLQSMEETFFLAEFTLSEHKQEVPLEYVCLNSLLRICLIQSVSNRQFFTADDSLALSDRVCLGEQILANPASTNTFLSFFENKVFLFYLTVESPFLLLLHITYQILFFCYFYRGLYRIPTSSWHIT